MIRGANESKTLKKHILWEYKSKFNGRKCNSKSRITTNVDVSVKKNVYMKKLQQILMKNIQSEKRKNFYILLVLLLITTALLIALTIYCYLIKYQAKQRHLLLHCDKVLY